MRLRTSTKIAWNSVFMVLAIIYLYLFLSLESNKALYTRFGVYLVDQYEKPYEHEYAKAVKALDQGNVELAIVTLKRWRSIKKGDRVFPQKRRLLLKLAEQLHEQNKHAQLLSWSQTWQTLDNRDITARAYYLEALRLTPEHHAEGVGGLALAYNQFPGNLRISRFHANSLREAGDFAAADKIHNRKITRPMVNWELFWDTGHGFNATEKSRLDVKSVDPENGDANANYSIDFTLPGDTQRFRLDLPPYSELEISGLRIHINQQPYPIDPTKLQLVMMRLTKSRFISTGESDPYIIFDINTAKPGPGTTLVLNIKLTLSNADGAPD